MENQQIENKSLVSKRTTFWSALDQENLVKTLGIIILGQKSFGEQRNIEDVFNYYRFKLERRFSVGQIISAIDEYTDKKTDVPAPADIIEILESEKPKSGIPFAKGCDAFGTPIGEAVFDDY